MQHSRFYAPVIVFIALAAALVTQPVSRALAHHVTLTGVATCQPQSWSITWTAANSESGKVMTIISPAGFAPNPVPFSGNAVRVQSGISFATPSVTSTISVSWPGSPPFFIPLVLDTDMATVNRPANCPPNTATPTQTRTATWTPTFTSTPTLTATPTTTTSPTPSATTPPTFTATPSATPTSTTTVPPTTTPTSTSTAIPSPTASPPPPLFFQVQRCEGGYLVTYVNGFRQPFPTRAPQCLPPVVVVEKTVVEVTVVQPPTITSSRPAVTPPRTGDAGLVDF